MCVLKEARLANQHALLCEFYTKKAVDKKDFDIAYSIEALARGAALRGETEAAMSLKEQARTLGNQIKDEAEKKSFDRDFSAEPWFGVT